MMCVCYSTQALFTKRYGHVRAREKNAEYHSAASVTIISAQIIVSIISLRGPEYRCHLPKGVNNRDILDLRKL